MHLTNQPDISKWITENNIHPALILGADAMDHVIFDEDSDLDEECYDELEEKYKNGYTLANNLTISPITIPITFTDDKGIPRIPFDDEKKLSRQSDTKLNSFLEIKVPSLEASITTIGYTINEIGADKYKVDESVIFKRDLSTNELEVLSKALGYKDMDEFKHMIMDETFLAQNGPVPFRKDTFAQLFDPDTYDKRVLERERLLTSITKALEHEGIKIPREQIKIENDFVINSNLDDNIIVVGDKKANFNAIMSGDNGVYYKGTIKEGEMLPDSIMPVKKLAYQDESQHTEYHMPNSMKVFLGLRAGDLGIERKDIELKGDRAVLNIEGDMDRYSHLYIKPFNHNHFDAFTDFNLYAIQFANAFSAVASADEAEKYNREHPIIKESEMVETDIDDNLEESYLDFEV